MSRGRGDFASTGIRDSSGTMDTVLIGCPNCGKELRLTDRRLLGRRARCKNCRHEFTLNAPEEPGAMLAGRQADDHAQPSNPPGMHNPLRGERMASDVPPEEWSPLRVIKRRRMPVRHRAVLTGVLMIGLIVIAGFVVWTNHIATESSTAAPDSAGDLRQSDRQSPLSRAEMIAAASPTHGHPMQLMYVPMGANIVIHLRPARLWSHDKSLREFRACWGPLADWAEAKIKDRCLFEPARIDRLLLCLILGVPGEPPDVAAVVHLQDEIDQSQLIERIGGERAHELSDPATAGPARVYIAGDRAYLIHDAKTFAVAPRALAGEMVDAVRRPSLPAVELQQLLPLTDQDRDLTVLFSPEDARRHQETLVPENVRPVFDALMAWFGEDVEAVAWSLHLNGDLYSEVLLRNRNIVKTTDLKNELEQKLRSLPEQILQAVQQMQPDTVGTRRLIGRFPAMTKVASMATLADAGDRYVRLTTVLPERAAPNLAVGTLLTWNESTRTGNGKASASAAADEPGALATGPASTGEPERIADRLKKPIEIDFRRAPLHEAFEYIGDVTRVRVEIDGQALKLAGYTKNMPQTFKLGTVPATKALYTIIKQYPEMIVVVDEENKLMTVTTKAAAAQHGWKPFPLEP